MSAVRRSAWPQVVGAIAFLLGAAIAVATLTPQGESLSPDAWGFSSQAMYSMEFSLGTAFLLGTSGLCLIGGLAFGRALFLWSMPLGAVALASTFPELLWPDDIPFTVLGVVLFAPFVFLLSRARAQATFGAARYDWAGRGGVNALLGLLVYGGLYAWVASTEVESGGPDWPGFEHLLGRGGGLFGGLTGANIYVAKKATALVLVAHAAGAFLAVAIPGRAPRALPSPPDPRMAHATSTTRDEFQLMSVMKFYLVIQILAPLFLIGLTAWAVNAPGLELSKAGPLILAGLGAWAIYELYRLIKWSGFTVTVTDTDITVGKRRVAWDEVAGATVCTAFKLDTWIEIRPQSGEALHIPAGTTDKALLLTLVEKHHPDLVKQ